MTLTTHRILYPEGDAREIGHRLRINQLVDLNGSPLQVPLQSPRTIAYRVYKISTQSRIGEEIISYSLEKVSRYELESYVD